MCSAPGGEHLNFCEEGGEEALVLVSDYPECLESEEDEEQSSREAFLKITLDFLRTMDQEQLAERLWSSKTITHLKRCTVLYLFLRPMTVSFIQEVMLDCVSVN